MVGWFSVVVGVTPSAVTVCAWKANPIRTEAAPTAYLRMENVVVFLVSLQNLLIVFYIDSVYIKQHPYFISYINKSQEETMENYNKYKN